MQQTHTFSIIGSSGFVGSNLLNYLIHSDLPIQKINLLSRKKINIPDSQVPIETIIADHLDTVGVKQSINEADIIFDTAGLAWQHPGQHFSNKTDLLKEQILQNAVSCAVIAKVLQPHQILVWTSTSAIDTFFNLVPENQKESIKFEIKKKARSIVNLDKKDVNGWRTAIDSLLTPELLAHFQSSNDQNLNFAINYSYAFSKVVGEYVFKALAKDNIRIVRISDVYGADQPLDKQLVIDKNLPARRAQRFTAAYKAIKEGDTSWIPKSPAELHGFSLKNNKISHTIWNDVVFPTYVSDVCKLLLKVALHKGQLPLVLSLPGKKLTNLEMVMSIQKILALDIPVNVSGKLVDTEIADSDFALIGEKRDKLINFDEGVKSWLSEQ